MSTGDMALWLAAVVMEAMVVALLIRRRFFRLLPVFCCYVLWSLVSDLAGGVVSRFYPDEYFTVFVVQSVLDAILQFGVLVELAWSVLRPYWSSLPRGAGVILALSVVAAGALVWPFAPIPGFGDFPPEWRLLMRLQDTFAILRVLFLLDLAGCSRVLEVGWRSRELQVAIGLGFYSLASLTVTFLHSQQLDSPYYHFFDQIASASYDCSLLYWIVSFAQKKEEQKRAANPKVQKLLLTVVGTRRAAAVGLENSPEAKSGRRGAA